jgi:hypothetical protein
MTERERTSTRTEGSDEVVTPGSGVEVFDTSADTNAAHPKPDRDVMVTDRTVSDTNSRGYIDPDRTTTPNAVDPGTNWNRLLVALAVIIVIVLLLYWIF